MAVREFDGTDDNINFDVDVLSSMTFGTVAVIFKIATGTTGDKEILTLHSSGGSHRASFPTLRFNNGQVAMHNGAGFSSTPTSWVTSNVWYLVVVRKATGTATPRFSKYDFGGDTWEHDPGDTTAADWTAPAAGGTVRTSVEGVQFYRGRLAVGAMWSNEVHWTADASGDTAIEAAGLETSLANWVDEAPDTLWPFNQASTGTAITDLINNADQAALVGTTVITDDDPPGFDFSLTTGPVPNLFVVRSNLQLR